jgi:hypothetical protein
LVSASPPVKIRGVEVGEISGADIEVRLGF